MLQEHPKLNLLQVNLLKSFQYLDSKESIEEIDSLINFYLEKKIDASIEQIEKDRNYTSKIYEAWLVEEKKYLLKSNLK